MPKLPTRGLVLLLSLGLSITTLGAEPETLELWSTPVPAGSAASEKVQERGDAHKPNRFITDITLPTLTVHLPPRESATGAAVVICPGGGYAGVAIDKEGHDVARWLNSIGIAGIVLKYRMPRAELTGEGAPLPLLDVQQALRLVRRRAKEWNVKSDRVGVMGFSAGGHLASMAATRFGAAATATGPASAPAGISDRPDFLILVYPVISMRDGVTHAGSRRRLLGENPPEERIEAFSSEKQVSPGCPPVFLVHVRNDPVRFENTQLFYDALKAHHVPAEMRLFDTGGHGFGLGQPGADVSTWPALCRRWMEHLNER